MSKIMNRTINKKNRKENGFRGLESRFMPHSNVECFSNHFFVNFIRNSGIKIISDLIVVAINMYIVNHIIICDHWHIEIVEDRRYRLELYKLLVQIKYIL